MSQSTRTAGEAAAACGCEVAQIVKSMIFENAAGGTLILCLTSGINQVNTSYLSKVYRVSLKQCDTHRVRDETGFAIGGLAPIGHLNPIMILMDKTLLRFDHVWAAAGRPDSVFQVKPQKLADAVDARIIKVVDAK